MRLAEGVWEGLLTAPSTVSPRLRLWHQDTLLGEPETIRSEQAQSGMANWLVRFQLPSDRLSDGVQTFVIEDAESGDALALETVIAGEVLDDDVRAEVALLRAELDLLKRAFRRHCSED
jgi:hypothetical protein